MSILLISPPFGSLGSPYISVPTLAAYLRSRGVRVVMADAGNELYRSLLHADNIRNAREYAENCVAELNRRPQLTFSEMARFAYMARNLSNARNFSEKMERMLDADVEYGPGERMTAMHAAIRLACSPYFPEVIEAIETHNIVTYISPFRKFSTPDILRSMEREGLLSGFFERLLAPLLQGDDPPRIAGISASFPDQIEAAFRCARVIKQLAPHIHVALGGAFVSCHMRNVGKPEIFEVFDSLILDDGEVPLEKLHAELSSPTPDLRRVPGLVYLSEGRVCRNAPVAPISMESLPPPAYDLLPLERYILPRKNMPLLLRLSRGCYWGRCAFCRTRLPMIHQHDQPSADYLFEQIRTVVEITGVRIFTFTDDSASPEVLEELSRRLIKEQLVISWVVNLRFDPRLTLERAILYRRAGCHYVTLGLEAFNDRLLRLIGKGTTTRMIDKVLLNFSWAGLPVSVYMIVGLPTETEEEAVKSFEEIEKRRNEGFIQSFMYHSFQIVPYSEIAERPMKYGIRRVHAPVGLDLDPPVFEFDGEGMPRRSARSLEAKFNKGAANGRAPGESPAKKRSGAESTLNNGGLALNYDMDAIASALQTVTDEAGACSMGEWLEAGERLIKPLRRR
jgi:radical SAM superfamily enzyme YgiQ (UPF0313 family)